MSGLDYLLWPRSIAIVGASADTASIRGRLLEHLLQRNYSGAVYLVSSTQAEIRGKKTFATLQDIPGEVDLVLIAVRAESTYEVLEQCAAIEAKFAVCFSSGFAEAGAAGAALQDRIRELAARTSMRISGPNTAGFYNVKGGIAATFARNADNRRPVVASKRPGPATVAVIAQSGGLGFALGDRCLTDHGLHVSYIIGTGNEVDLQVLDFVDYAIADQDTRVVLLLIESFRSVERLAAVAARARSVGKPIVVAKFGRTDAGSRAVESHAGRLTGSDEAYGAVLRRRGLIRVHDEDLMTDLAAVFSYCPLPGGRRVGILTTSGGAGVWMADACESAGLVVPLLDEATQTALKAFVPSYGGIQNPVDLTAQVTVNSAANTDGPTALVGALTALVDSPSIDAVILIANMSDGALLSREQHGVAALVKSLKKPLLLYSHAPPSRSSQDLVQALGLVCISSTTRVAQVLARVNEHAEALKESGAEPEAPVTAILQDDRELAAAGMCEYEAKALLSRYGIRVTNERLATSETDAAEAASQMGSQVALKIQSRQIPHKTEMGGVILGLKTKSDVRAAYNLLIERARNHTPHAVIDGVLVQEMLPPGQELAIGVVTDPNFGPMMMVGLGGIYVEIFDDIVIEPLPVRRRGALDMLQRLRAWPILSGARGKAASDVSAVTEIMEKVSSLVESSGGAICELDLNPVFVYEGAQGATVVDALIVGREGVIPKKRQP